MKTHNASFSLNERFRSRLSDIVESIAVSARAMDHPLQEAQKSIKELNDYICFELQKCQLELDQLSWSDRIDPNYKQRVEEWKQMLTDIKASIPSSGLSATVDVLDKLFEKLQAFAKEKA